MEEIRRRFESLLYGQYSHRRMLERGITPAMIREAVFSDGAEVIEDYPEDARGHSCLVLGYRRDGRPLHIILGLAEFFLITVYDPSVDQLGRWADDWKTRIER